ncbi:hypothetical protein BJX70DRAFT_384745, partial [Aspergillus crustosus]
ITRFSLPNKPTSYQLRSLPVGSLLALRSYLKGLKSSYISNLNNHRASIPSTIQHQARSTLRLIMQILFKIEITALLTTYRLIFKATNQQALNIRAFKLRILQSAIYKLNSHINKYHNILSSSFLEPFNKICHAITYAADSFDERGYRVCDKHGNKVNMSA